MNSQLLIFTVPFTPVLRVIKDGCTLSNVDFIIVHPPKKIMRVIFHFFRIIGFYSIALFFISPTTYKKVKHINREIPVLYWGSNGITIWMTIDRLIKSSKKYIFSWAPMEEDAFLNKNVFLRKIKRIGKAAKNGFEFYTYNPHDARKYKMNLTSQVYRRFWGVNGVSKQSDFYFVGKNKNREGVLRKIENILTKKGYNVDFRIFEEKPIEFIPYDENVRLTMGTRCIVDLVATKYNAGMTLRPLEALFFKKKLLTNDKSVKKSDFYHPDNIFVIDDNYLDLDGIEEFMKKPFHEISESIVERYDVNNWLKHYFIDKE